MYIGEEQKAETMISLNRPQKVTTPAPKPEPVKAGAEATERELATA